MKGVKENFLDIIEKVNEKVRDVIADMDAIPIPFVITLKIVWELYASYVLFHKKNKDHEPIEDEPFLTIVLIRRVEVLCTFSKINNIYFGFN